MIEMLGVLAIAGVLTVGGIAGYSKAMEQYKINKAIGQITQTLANVQTIYAQQSTYDNIRNFYMDDMFIPKDAHHQIYLSQDCLPYNSIYAYALLYDSTDEVSFNECIALASYDWKTEIGDKLIGIQMGRSEIDISTPNIDLSSPNATSHNEFKGVEGKTTYGGYYVGAYNLPLTPDKAVEYCQKVEEYKQNLDWYSSRFVIYVGK